MQFQLPPRYIARALLRRTRQQKERYRRWFDVTYDNDWKPVGREKPSSLKLIDLAAAFDAQLDQAGAFAIERDGSPDRLRLKTDVGYSVDGHVLWSVTWGQNLEITSPAYTERGLMLARTGMAISRKKVTAYESPLCLVWAAHALERLCERGGIKAETDLEQALRLNSLNVCRTLATTVAFGLTRTDGEAEEDSLTSWIPFRDGLLIVTLRYLGAKNSSVEVGWRFNFTKHHFTNIYIGKNLLQGDGEGRSERTDGAVITGAWVVTTFIGPDQLSAAQRAYAARLNAFLGALAPGTIDLAYKCWFDPDFIVRPAMDEKFQLNDTLMEMYEELQRLMDAGGFKAHPRHQLTYLLDVDLSDAEFRDGLPVSG